MNWLGLFFFMRFEGFFCFIGPLALPATSIHLPDAGRGLEYSLGLNLDGFIKHFVPEVQLPMSTIYLGPNGWP